MDVLLVAVKKDKISDYTSAISQAGKNPQIVDVDVFALQNCYEVNYGIDPGRVVALLNVGASIMNINIVKGGTSIFNRDIAVGGNQYTDAIQKDLNLSFDQAEALKRGAAWRARLPRTCTPILQARLREHRPRDPEDLRLLQGDELRGPYRPHLPRGRHVQGPGPARTCCRTGSRRGSRS